MVEGRERPSQESPQTPMNVTVEGHGPFPERGRGVLVGMAHGLQNRLPVDAELLDHHRHKAPQDAVGSLFQVLGHFNVEGFEARLHEIEVGQV